MQLDNITPALKKKKTQFEKKKTGFQVAFASNSCV